MNSFSESLYREMEDRVNTIEISIYDPLLFAEEAVKIIIPIIERLKVHFATHTFENESEEIRFFKITKPKFLSSLIYYNEIYIIETNRLYGGERALRKFYLQELGKLKRFLGENHEFCKYYKTGNDCFDAIYFLRRSPNIRLSINTAYLLFDPVFSTMHDFTVARILANKRIEAYIKQELKKLDHPNSASSTSPVFKLKWTGSKAGLIELIYALHTEGVFNNGNSDLKEVAFFIEAIFGVNLGQYHRVFLEIRNRKNERTKFLNSLKEKLVKRMEDADEA